MSESPIEPDHELIDVATRLIAARTDDRFHTTAAAARKLLPWAYGWGPESGSTPFQD